MNSTASTNSTALLQMLEASLIKHRFGTGECTSVVMGSPGITKISWNPDRANIAFPSPLCSSHGRHADLRSVHVRRNSCSPARLQWGQGLWDAPPTALATYTF